MRGEGEGKGNSSREGEVRNEGWGGAVWGRSGGSNGDIKATVRARSRTRNNGKVKRANSKARNKGKN